MIKFYLYVLEGHTASFSFYINEKKNEYKKEIDFAFSFLPHCPTSQNLSEGTKYLIGFMSDKRKKD